MIRKRHSVVAAALVLAAVPVLWGGEYHSPFGYTIELPSDWIVLSGKEIKDNPDLFKTGLKELSSADPDLIRLVQQEIEAGNLEIFFYQSNDVGATANINVSKGVGRLPSTGEEVAKFCKQFATLLSKSFNTAVSARACDRSQLPSGAAMYLESNGPRAGTVMAQFQIQKSPSVFLTVTGTFGEKIFPTMKDRFEQIVRSLKFD
jgi:hypothetical protein